MIIDDREDFGTAARVRLTTGKSFQRGAKAKIGGKFVVDPQFERAVTNARWEALYPQSLRDEMPANEQDLLASHEVASRWVAKTAASGPQPLSIEGTTFASAQLYEHDPAAREERMRDFIDCKTSLEAFSPNILRVFKTLDVCETGEHAFYNSMVETSFSPKSPLFTDGPLRSMGAACCHVRYAKVSPAGHVTEAGASPKDLATGEYALVPLWTAGTDDGALKCALRDFRRAEETSAHTRRRGQRVRGCRRCSLELRRPRAPNEPPPELVLDCIHLVFNNVAVANVEAKVNDLSLIHI